MIPPAAGRPRRDIPALHAAIVPVHLLHEQRRALYRLATTLLQGDHSRMLDLDVLDNPLTRKHIGDALAGRRSLDCSRLAGIGALADAARTAHGLPVTNRPDANTLLADVLTGIGAELGVRHPTCGPPQLLTENDGERFDSALAVVRDGIALAKSVSPELMADLLPHIALLGIVDAQRAGGLASASSRTVPGLVLLESPRSSLAVAEALVHEGAHQKLFDLAITHDLLNSASDRCPPFEPPWPPAGRRWPLEQSLAACHAYCCLAVFAQHTAAAGLRPAISADSLLPHARARSTTLGQWLLDNGDCLGSDAHTLLEGLLGRRPRRTAERYCPAATAGEYIVGTGLLVHRFGSSDRVLIGQPVVPPQLYWVSAHAATLLELLGHKPLDEVADTLAERWQLSRIAATDRMTTLLAELCASGLVRPRCDTT